MNRITKTALTTAGSIAALVGTLATADSAGAYTIASSSLPVKPTVYQVQGLTYAESSAVTQTMYKPWLYQAGPVAYRLAPSDGTEYVQVNYRVDKWNGTSWVSWYSTSKSAQIASTATSVQLPALSVLPGAGYFKVSESLAYTNAIGAVTGSQSWSMNQSGDYTCRATLPCSVGGYFIHLASS